MQPFTGRGGKASPAVVAAALVIYGLGLSLGGAGSAQSIGGLCNGRPASHTLEYIPRRPFLLPWTVRPPSGGPVRWQLPPCGRSASPLPAATIVRNQALARAIGTAETTRFIENAPRCLTLMTP